MTRVSAGSLEVGKPGAGGPVENYMSVSVDQVGGIESVVTMVGGKVVFAVDRFKKLEQ
jgi:hypothetical protein